MAFHDQGSLEAFAFPALNHMISQWVPEKEKSAFVSFAYVGGTFGSIITNPMCGAILATLGWEVRWIAFCVSILRQTLLTCLLLSIVQAVFYITAAVTVVWCVVWQLLAQDSPDTSSFISEDERKYILAHRNFDDSKDSKDDVPMIPLLMWVEDSQNLNQSVIISATC